MATPDRSNFCQRSRPIPESSDKTYGTAVVKPEYPFYITIPYIHLLDGASTGLRDHHAVCLVALKRAASDRHLADGLCVITDRNAAQLCNRRGSFVQPKTR
jgi:hypothetical protein